MERGREEGERDEGEGRGVTVRGSEERVYKGEGGENGGQKKENILKQGRWRKKWRGGREREKGTR